MESGIACSFLLGSFSTLKFFWDLSILLCILGLAPFLPGEQNSIVWIHHNLFIHNFFNLLIFDCTGSSLLRMDFLYLCWARASLLCGVWSFHCSGFSYWGAQALGHSGSSSSGTRAPEKTQQLRCMGLVAPWHVGFSETKDRTCASWTGRWIPSHCARKHPGNVYLGPLIWLFLEAT